jgi:hypothetical protein
MSQHEETSLVLLLLWFLRPSLLASICSTVSIDALLPCPLCSNRDASTRVRKLGIVSLECEMSGSENEEEMVEKKKEDPPHVQEHRTVER